MNLMKSVAVRHFGDGAELRLNQEQPQVILNDLPD
jgi:hypothetical protein